MAKKETKVQEEVKEVKAAKAPKVSKKASKKVEPKKDAEEKCDTACECEEKCLELTKEEVLEMAKLHKVIADVERFMASIDFNIKIMCVRLAEFKIETLENLNKYCETDRQKEIFDDSIQTLANRLSKMSLTGAILDSATSPISGAFGLASVERIQVKD